MIIVESHELQPDNTVFLGDRRADHIRKVLRALPGDTVKIGILNGPQGTADLLEITQRDVTLQVALGPDSPLEPETDLILALPRPIMLKRVLAQSAAMGVARIFLINANRVEKSFFHASLLTNESYRDFLIQGLEQAVDTWLPEVSIHTRFKPFVEDFLPEIKKECPVRLVAHPGSQKSLPKIVSLPLQQRVLLAIGPEGGWVDFEIEKFLSQGLSPFSLGPRILRVDSVVPALLAQLTLLRQIKEQAFLSPDR